MNFKIHSIDQKILSLIVDDQTFRENVLFCKGGSTLTIGNIVLNDENEVLVRVLEVISILRIIFLTRDDQVDNKNFDYVFDPKFTMTGRQGNFIILDRENGLEIVEAVTKQDALAFSEKLSCTINDSISKYSPFLAKKYADDISKIINLGY